MRTVGAVVVAVLLTLGRPEAQAPRSVLVFAAVSLKGALDEVREQAADVRYLGRYPTVRL